MPYGYRWARMYICLHVCARQAQIHGFLHTTKGVRERVTVRNYYLQGATTKHPAILSSVCGGDTVSVQAAVYF